MAFYPRAQSMLLTEAGCIGPTGNQPRRYIIHATGTPDNVDNSAAGNVATWQAAVRHDRHFHVSAHFTIEKDGTVVQHLDTDNVAYGTGAMHENAIHVEHTGSGHRELTFEQLWATSRLLAWLYGLTNGNLPLQLSGADCRTPGVTCHRHIQEQYHREQPHAHIEWRICPGPRIIAQMQTIIEMAAQIAGFA